MATKANPSGSNFLTRLLGGLSLIPGGYVAWTGAAPLWARIWLGAGAGLWLLFTLLLGLIAAATN